MTAGPKRIPAARIREVWADRSLTTQQAADLVGLTRSNLRRRAKALGLPSRRVGNRVAITDEALFRRLWEAGVGLRSMAEHFGVHWQTPSDTARRLGLPMRPVGGHRRPPTVAEFFAAEAEVRLARAMARSAKAENAALARVLRPDLRSDA